MCMFEVESPCEVYVTTWRVARKPHRCTSCGGAIVAGAQYQHHGGIHDGNPFAENCCFACAFALREFGEEHRGYPSPSWFLEALTECIGFPSDKGDPDVDRWRDLLAAAKRRGRARVA